MKSNIKYDVNIDLANETKKAMAKALETNDERVLEKLGFEFQNENVKDSVTFLNYILYNKRND